MYTWNERLTCFLSLNNASSISSSLVWLYHANRLVGSLPYISMGENWLCSNQGVNLTKLLELRYVYMERTSNLFAFSK